MTRFPTYAAEEALRARAAEPVPLHGTPAPPLPEHVVDAVARALSSPMRTPPARGLDALREALAQELERSTGRAVDTATELVVTNGAMQALGVVFRTVLEPGDEVVVPSPCFFFETAIRRGGGSPVHVASSAERGWSWDLDALEAAAAARRARVLLLCNPENPTGHVPSSDEISTAVEIAERNGLLVVTDEAYERSLWDGARLTSAFAATEHALVVRSLGKSLSMPHLRIGCFAGPGELVARCAATLEWDCLRVGLASQAAALAALTGPADWLDAVQLRLAGDRQVALETVAGAGDLAIVAPEAGPFLLLGTHDSRASLADELLAVGLPVVDGAHFHADGWARLPFGGARSCPDALEAALREWAGRRG